jgi:hypothetical protein
MTMELEGVTERGENNIIRSDFSQNIQSSCYKSVIPSEFLITD